MMKPWYPARALQWACALMSCVALLSTAACGVSTSTHTAPQPTPSPTALPTATPTPVPRTIGLMSSAFQSGTSIPPAYTCQGANVSPPLAWSNAPQQTATFVLLMDDVTGPSFSHWVLFNVPAGTRALPAEIPAGGQLTSGARQGTDDVGVVGYYGPCPPNNKTDDYVFTLYALNVALSLDAGVTEQQVLSAARDHILAQGQMDGTYMLHNP